MSIVLLILCAVVGYLLGNFQTGLFVGKLSNVDLREHGSKNSGATNALRVLGSKQALFTLLGDALKGVLAVVLGRIICGREGGMVATFFVVLGHIWPVFYRFRGGKGAATSIGALVTLMPLQSLIMIGIGVVIICLTKMVSLGSMVGAIVFMAICLIKAIPSSDWFLLVFGIAMAALVIFAHRANIGRILKGNENKLSWAMFAKKKKRDAEAPPKTPHRG